MKRKRTAIRLRKISAQICVIPLTCFALTLYVFIFGEAIPIYLADFLFFAFLIAAFTMAVAALLGGFFGVVLDVLNPQILPSAPNVSLKYHLRLLLWAFIYNLMLNMLVLALPFTATIEVIAWPFVIGFCFWGVISQILAYIYLQKIGKSEKQFDN